MIDTRTARSERGGNRTYCARVNGTAPDADARGHATVAHLGVYRRQLVARSEACSEYTGRSQTAVAIRCPFGTAFTSEQSTALLPKTNTANKKKEKKNVLKGKVLFVDG